MIYPSDIETFIVDNTSRRGKTVGEDELRALNRGPGCFPNRVYGLETEVRVIHRVF